VEDLAGVVGVLEAQPLDIRVRAALAVFRGLLDARDQALHDTYPREGPRLDEGLEPILLEWLQCPCPEHLELAGEAVFRAREIGWGFVDSRGESSDPTSRIQTWFRFVIVGPFSDVRASVDGLPPRLLSEIRAELIPWLLREADPLAERVKARD
jgi:hypothetical protein